MQLFFKGQIVSRPYPCRLTVRLVPNWFKRLFGYKEVIATYRSDHGTYWHNEVAGELAGFYFQRDLAEAWAQWEFNHVK